MEKNYNFPSITLNEQNKNMLNISFFFYSEVLFEVVKLASVTLRKK